jgi:hypothetical protein
MRPSFTGARVEIISERCFWVTSATFGPLKSFHVEQFSMRAVHHAFKKQNSVEPQISRNIAHLLSLSARAMKTP